MAAHWDCVADELIKGGMGQWYSNICLDYVSGVMCFSLYTVLYSSYVVASWTAILKDTV